MRILFFTYEIAEKGGNYVRSFSLAKNLVKMGHDVTLVASSKIPSFRTTESVIEGVRVAEVGCIFPHRVRHDGMSPMQVIMRLRYIRGSYDVVHFFGHRPAVFLPAYIIARLKRVPLFADWSDLWGWGGIAMLRGHRILSSIIGTFDTLNESLAYSLADEVTVISKLLQKKVRGFAPKKKTHLLSAGCDIDEVIQMDKMKSRKKLKLPSGKPIITFLGNAHYDLDLVFATYAKLKKRVPNALLLIVGNKTQDVINLHEKMKFDKNVITSGFVEHQQISPYLAASDVLLLPFRNNQINLGRFPNKLGDYLAAGRPIVANPTRDIKDFIGDTKSVVFTVANSTKMAEACESIITHPHQALMLSKRARSLAKNKSWYTVAQELEKLYKQTLEL